MLEIPVCIQWLTDCEEHSGRPEWYARVLKIHDRISILHVLVFEFLVPGRRSSLHPAIGASVKAVPAFGKDA